MCIKTDFEKLRELKGKCHRNKTKISILQDQVKLSIKEINKNPFNFLRNSNNIDLCNKKQKQLRSENIDMQNEMKDIPKQIKKQLCDSIVTFFSDKNKKLQLEADLAVDNVFKDIKRKKFIKHLNLTGSSLFLLFSIYFIRKKVQSQK